MSQHEEKEKMDRRKAVKNMSLAFAAVSSLPAFAGLSEQAVFAQGKAIHKHLPAKPAVPGRMGGLTVLNAHQNATVSTLCELIIPQTTTAGAKAARVNEFIDTYLTSLSPSQRLEFLEGLQWIDQRSQALFQKPFVRATPQQQEELLTRLSVPHSLEDPAGRKFFEEIKSLTVFGYYTSKVGIEEELKFDGWVDYKGCTHPEHQT
jgi:hypothetical protein